VLGAFAFGDRDMIVTDSCRILRDMLQSGQLGMIAFGAQSMQYVTLVIRHCETAVRQPEHPVAVSALAGQQACAGRGARRISIMRVAEQNAFFREALQVRRGHSLTVRLDVTAGVMRVQIQNIRPASGQARLREGGGRSGGGKAFQCIPTVHAHYFISVNECPLLFVR
jgi:hypothetical protein